MQLDRRSVLTGAALAAAAGAARAQTAPAPAATPTPAAKPSLEERYAAAAKANRHQLAWDGSRFSGAGWDLLVDEGRKAQFTLLGEDHFMAEIPALAGQLYAALRPSGYSRVSVEISPPAARMLDGVLREGGMPALKRWFAANPSGVAFYNMKAEAEFIVAARAATPGREQVLWGTDYEVGADRALIAELKRTAPAGARAAVAALDAAAAAGWAEFHRTKNPMTMFPFGGDPKLVQAVRAAWPGADEQTQVILDTLENTLVVNAHYRTERYYLSNQVRADFQRASFLRQWRAERAAGRKPRVLMKYGANHLVRGLSYTYNFDLGALVSELAIIEGGHAFRVLLLGGPGARQGLFDPVNWRTVPTAAESLEDQGLGFATGALFDEGFTVFDLRPMRTLPASKADPRLVRVVHGFDAMVILPGATPSVFL